MANIGFEQPRSVVAYAENQKQYQRTNSQAFYSMLPPAYYSWYQNWVRLWLQWYDGYVDVIHGSSNGLLSTHIGTTIVDRSADLVFGGNLMFSNTRKPQVYIEKKGKKIGAALNFIANEWSFKTDFKIKVKKAFRYAFAGGISLLKLNNSGGALWVDNLRADRFYYELTNEGELRHVISLVSFYTETIPGKKDNLRRYALVEDRHFEKVTPFKEIPVVEYRMYEASTPIQFLSTSENYVKYEDLPKSVKSDFRAQYDCALNQPKAMNGFKTLGCYLFMGSDGVSDVPDLQTGESLLAHITTYLFEYDFYNTCLNTDMYLARGRIIVPKHLQSAAAQAGQNSGLDDFLYTKVDTMSTDDQKPTPIQFEIRAEQWRSVRNTLLESIATTIGLSVSTLASYLQDGSNRTAREVSAEESATTLFVENNRRRFEKPINECLCDVLRFYGYTDDVEVHWSRSGMSNPSVMVDYLTKAVDAGLISRKKAHKAFNFDEDEELIEEDWALVEEERAQDQNSIFNEAL